VGRAWVCVWLAYKIAFVEAEMPRLIGVGPEAEEHACEEHNSTTRLVD